MSVGIVTVPVWGVHIADGVLAGPWLLAGFLFAAVLAGVGAFRIREEEIPRVAVLTAVFFIASLIHVRVGPTSVHLLLNGLVGVVLGWRAALAIPVGLFLQAALIGHGAFSTLGVNACVLVLPALTAGFTLRALGRAAWLRRSWVRGGVVAGCAAAGLLSLVYGVVLLVDNGLGGSGEFQLARANAVLAHPATWAVTGLVSALAAWGEYRLGHPPEFPLGLVAGELTVLLTLVLNSLALVLGGAADWHTVALLVFLAHLPIAVIEGFVLGFTVSFLARVQPGLVGLRRESPAPAAVACGSPLNGCHSSMGITSSSGTSH